MIRQLVGTRRTRERIEKHRASFSQVSVHSVRYMIWAEVQRCGSHWNGSLPSLFSVQRGLCAWLCCWFLHRQLWRRLSQCALLPSAHIPMTAISAPEALLYRLLC